jgi:hypothetical protein
VGWINQTSSGQGEHTNLVQSLIDNHNDLHSEIEGNDLNPKDANKKVKVVIEK